MNKLSAIGVILPGMLIGSAAADLYFDDPFDANWQDNLDIVSVNVSDNGNDVSISVEVLNLNADWGKYLIFIDAHPFDGSGDNDNPWARNVAGMSGTDYFIGSYIDGLGGSYLYNNNGGNWNYSDDLGSPIVDYAANTVTWNLGQFATSLAMFGAEGFNFNIGTTGGSQGDPAIDLLVGSGAPWGGQANSGGEWAYYEFSTVPAPGALVLLGMAGIATRRRR